MIYMSRFPVSPCSLSFLLLAVLFLGMEMGLHSRKQTRTLLIRFDAYKHVLVDAYVHAHKFCLSVLGCGSSLVNVLVCADC